MLKHGRWHQILVMKSEETSNILSPGNFLFTNAALVQLQHRTVLSSNCICTGQNMFHIPGMLLPIYLMHHKGGKIIVPPWWTLLLTWFITLKTCWITASTLKSSPRFTSCRCWTPLLSKQVISFGLLMPPDAACVHVLSWPRLSDYYPHLRCQQMLTYICHNWIDAMWLQLMIQTNALQTTCVLTNEMEALDDACNECCLQHQTQLSRNCQPESNIISNVLTHHTRWACISMHTIWHFQGSQKQGEL